MNNFQALFATLGMLAIIMRMSDIMNFKDQNIIASIFIYYCGWDLVSFHLKMLPLENINKFSVFITCWFIVYSFSNLLRTEEIEEEEE